MGILLLVGLAGFTASLVNTSLGMGYGQISSTVLLGAGLTPAVVSGTVNLGKVMVGTVGGAAHWHFGNIDPRLAVRLALPGSAGALVGVTVLANVDGDGLRPYLAGLLLVIGIRILRRFNRSAPSNDTRTRPAPAPASASVPAPGAGPAGGRELDPAGAAVEPAGGRGVDVATGAGGDSGGLGLGVAAFAGGVTSGLIGLWGPLVTPVLLRRKGLEPRVVVGSVNAAEIVVALVAVTSLLASLGRAAVDGGVLGSLVVAGVIAAPLAAWAIRGLPARQLGVAVGLLLVVTNAHVLTSRIGVGGVRWSLFALAVIAAAAVPALRRRTAAAAALTVS